MVCISQIILVLGETKHNIYPPLISVIRQFTDFGS
jgi:hypothetical protein